MINESLSCLLCISIQIPFDVAVYGDVWSAGITGQFSTFSLLETQTHILYRKTIQESNTYNWRDQIFYQNKWICTVAEW